MKLLITLIATLWISPLFANEMPSEATMTDSQRLDLIEDLFEDGEVVKTIDKATGEITGFHLKHDSLKDSDTLSFNKDEMD